MEDGSSPYCFFHPREFVLGVCSICLKERLLILASKKQGTKRRRTLISGRAVKITTTAAIVIPNKAFSLRSFLRRQLDSWWRLRKTEDSDDDDDSFISIKFEDDGKPSWNGNNVDSLQLGGKGGRGGGEGGSDKTSAEIEHRSKIRWRRRVSDHLLQVLHWKRSSSNQISSRHVALEVAEAAGEGRTGWMRRLMKRRTTTSADVDV